MWPTKEAKQKSVSKEQPNHPGQVFDYPGDEIKLRRHPYQSDDLVVTTVRQIDETWILVRQTWIGGIFEGREDTKSLSMADMGMIPYPHGVWNQHNWVTLDVS